MLWPLIALEPKLRPTMWIILQKNTHCRHFCKIIKETLIYFGPTALIDSKTSWQTSSAILYPYTSYVAAKVFMILCIMLMLFQDSTVNVPGPSFQLKLSERAKIILSQLWHFKNVMSQLHHRHVTSNNRRVCQRLADCFKNQPLEKHKQSPQTPEWEDECCQGGNCEEKWAGQLVCLKKTCHKVTLSIICSVVYCFFFHNTLC